MRTTVSLDPPAEAIVRRLMRERGIGFKEAINTAIVDGAATAGRVDYVLPTFDLGTVAGLDDITGLLNQLDDEEYLRKQELGK